MAALHLCSPDSLVVSSGPAGQGGSRPVSRGSAFSAGSRLQLLPTPSAATFSEHRLEGERGLIVVTLCRTTVKPAGRSSSVLVGRRWLLGLPWGHLGPPARTRRRRLLQRVARSSPAGRGHDPHVQAWPFLPRPQVTCPEGVLPWTTAVGKNRSPCPRCVEPGP